MSASRGCADISSLQMRNYVGEMSRELAKMARGQGDEKLAVVLDIAADLARNQTFRTIG